MKVSKTQNKALGILTALGVVLALAVIQGLVYYSGYISYWVPFVSVFGAMYAYFFFNHKISGAEIAIIVLAVCIISIAAEFATLGIIAGGMGEVFDLMSTDSEVLTAVMTDIIVTILLSVIAGVIVGIMFKKKVKQYQDDKKFEEQLAETQAKIIEANAKTEESNSENTEEKETTEKADTTIEQGNE